MKRECKLIVFLLLWMLSGNEGDEENHCKLINFLGCLFLVVFTFLKGRECKFRIAN